MKTTAQAASGFTSAQCVEIVLRRAASFADAAEKRLECQLPYMSLPKCYAALKELNRLTGEWSEIIRLAARDMEANLSKIDTFNEAAEATDNALVLIRHTIKCYESGCVRVGIDEISVEQLVNDMAKEEKAKAENQPATAERTAAKDKYMTAEIMCSLGKLYELQGRYAEAEEMYKNAMKIRVEVIGKGMSEFARSGIKPPVICRVCGWHRSEGEQRCPKCRWKEFRTRNNTLMT